jgi:hypothetical protein
MDDLPGDSPRKKVSQQLFLLFMQQVPEQTEFPFC